MRGSAHMATLQSEPRFPAQTKQILSSMISYSTHELESIFRISAPLARDLKSKFANFYSSDSTTLAAVDSYDGVVYKHFKGEEHFSDLQAAYLQRRVRISSLMYGVLRPFDSVRPYRMEGFVRMADSDERVDRFWRDHQTQTLIDDVTAEGGALLYLASKEEQNAFHWREVKSRVKVIDIQFLQRKGDKLRQVVIYTKMARGEMIRYMIDNDINNPEHLKSFEWGGYRYDELLSSGDVWVWVME